MPHFEIDLNPLEHVTVDAIGKPGARVFYIQGWRKSDAQPVTLIIEKVQLQSLALGVDQMLGELAKQKPELTLSWRNSTKIKCTSVHRWTRSSEPGKWASAMMRTTI